MNRNLTALAGVFMLVAAVTPVAGYHLLDFRADSNPNATVAAPGAINDTPTDDPDQPGAADWLRTNDFLMQGNLIICESNGGEAAALDNTAETAGGTPHYATAQGVPDDLNPSISGGDTILFGTGGLCYTGENAVTGVPRPANENVASGDLDDDGVVDPGEPARWIRLDACRRTMSERAAVANDCATNPAQHSGYGWTARIGIFECFIPTENTLNQGGTDLRNVADANHAEVDWALYYDRLYAWWSYEVDPDPATGNWIQLGDGWYTRPADGTDGAENNAGPFNTASAAPDGVDNEDYFHGHVSMFIDASAGNTRTNPVGGTPEASGSAFTDGPATSAALKTAIDAVIDAAPFNGMTINGVAGEPSDFRWTSDPWDNQFVESAGVGATTVDTENTGGTFWENDCGSSPACPSLTLPLDAMYQQQDLANPDQDQVDNADLTSECPEPYGPVVRGPSVDI